MTLSEKLFKLYPELTPDDFIKQLIIIRDDSDGKGAYIARWDHPTLPRPTQEQLDGIN